MSRTSCKAEMRFTDVTALDDATLSSADKQSFGNLELFKNNTQHKKYGTLELNQFFLDGTLELFPENPKDIAFWSSAKSLKDCSFEDNPAIMIAFTSTHSSSGLTLYFTEHYPTEVKITWYTVAGTKLDSKTFYPDSIIYTCQHLVQNYGRVKIEFVKTHFPCCYAKMQYILYGLYISWEDDLVQSASVTEEIDFTSGTLPINTADISIVDAENDFDIGNKDGAWRTVQKTQKIELTEMKDGVKIPAGTFYIDDFKFKKNVASFELIDTIGLMDKYTFYDGEIYKSRKAGKILESIFACAGVSKYEIAEEVYNIPLDGYLEIQTCREALQMVCFACGALADDSRSDTVRVYKPDRYVRYTVGTERKFNGQTSISLDDYISGVSIERSVYTLEDKDSEIYNDYLPKGLSRITFSDPYLPTSVKVTGGTAKVVKTNYIEVEMSAAGTCTITGKKYTSSKITYQKDVPILEAGESEKVKRFGTCTMYNTEILKENAERLLSYYALRKKIDMKYLMDLERVGNWINIDSINGNTSTTLIEEQTIDLTGGFISKAKCRGYSIVVTDSYYTGTELYAGGGGII